MLDSTELVEAGAEYIVNYSTLTEEDGIEKPYSYERFEITFPSEVLAMAGGETRTGKYHFTINPDGLRSDAGTADNKSVIRVANFVIPDHDIAEEMVRRHLRKFTLDDFWQDYFKHAGVELDSDKQYSIEIILPDNTAPLTCHLIYEDTVCEIWEGQIDCYEAIICVGTPIDDGPGSGPGGPAPDPEPDPDPDPPPGSGGPGDGDSGEPKDPCDMYANRYGGGNHEEFDPAPDGGGDGTPPNLPECLEEEEEVEEPEPGLTCDDAAEVIESLTSQGIIQDLEQESGFNNTDHG